MRQEQHREPKRVARDLVGGGSGGVCDTHRLAAGRREQVLRRARARPARLAAGRREDAPGVDASPHGAARHAQGRERGRSIAATSADGGGCVAANASDTPSRVAHAEARSVGVDVRVMYASAKSAASANDHATAPMRRHARISCTSRTYHA